MNTKRKSVDKRWYHYVCHAPYDREDTSIQGIEYIAKDDSVIHYLIAHEIIYEVIKNNQIDLWRIHRRFVSKNDSECSSKGTFIIEGSSIKFICYCTKNEWDKVKKTIFQSKIARKMEKLKYITNSLCGECAGIYIYRDR